MRASWNAPRNRGGLGGCASLEWPVVDDYSCMERPADYVDKRRQCGLGLKVVS
jgi:hypothetical protein